MEVGTADPPKEPVWNLSKLGDIELLKILSLICAVLIWICLAVVFCHIAHSAERWQYGEQKLQASCYGGHISRPEVRRQYCVSCCGRRFDGWSADDYRPRGSFDRCMRKCMGR